MPAADEPLLDALLEAIAPKVIVIADSESPATRQAGLALQERLAHLCIPVIYTRGSSAVSVVVDDASWKLQTLDGPTFTSAALSDGPKHDAPPE